MFSYSHKQTVLINIAFSVFYRYMDVINLRYKTKDLSKEITNFLSEENINSIAREIGFVERESP